MVASVANEIRAEPNLTPLLDVVFQLITFFMLVFKISGANFDQRVRLPVAGSAMPVEGSVVDQDRIVLNIDADGRLLWNGQVLDVESGIRKIRDQAELARLNLKIGGKPVVAGENLPTTVIFRADRGVPFSQIYRYIQSCQANGFTRFALKAMNAEG
jgi:biopolymer transport protein ExbD